MSMGKFIVCAGVGAMSALAFAAKTPLTEAEKAEKQKQLEVRRAEHRAKRLAAIAEKGGLVACPISGKVLRIKVESDSVSVADLEPTVVEMRRLLRLAIELGGKDVTSTNQVGAYVLLADQGLEKPTLLCAPEDNWSVVNVSRLVDRCPDAATRKSRIIKELWRAVAYALGAANSQQQPCVMRPISKPAELDLQKVAIVSPGPLMAIKRTAGEMGFARGGEVTYETACQQGWAPAPTNDVQKAIWDKVHAMPTAPLKIKPETKKVAQ